MRRSLVLITATLILAACSDPPKLTKLRSRMSQRERDSVLAESGLPGSGVVKKGMHIADIEAKRAAMLDSVTSSY